MPPVCGRGVEQSQPLCLSSATSRSALSTSSISAVDLSYLLARCPAALLARRTLVKGSKLIACCCHRIRAPQHRTGLGTQSIRPGDLQPLPWLVRLDDLERRLPEHILQVMRPRPENRVGELLELQARALDRPRHDLGASPHVLTEQNHDGVTVDTARQPLRPAPSRDR